MHEAQEATLVTIGIDPHKRTHTAVAVDEHRQQLGELQVVASPAMTPTLLRWASAWPARRWAIEGSDGLGRLLARQLVAARETVVDVPPTLASQVRLLRTGNATLIWPHLERFDPLNWPHPRPIQQLRSGN